MNKFLIVLGHTYFSRLKTKAFIISTAIMIGFVALFANLGSIIEYFMNDEMDQIAVIDESDLYFTVLEASIKEMTDEISLVRFGNDEEAGIEAVKDNDFSGLLVLNEGENHLPIATYYENNAVESFAEMTIEQQIQQLKIAIATEQAGVDEATLASIYEPVQFDKIALDETAKTDEELDAARGIVYVMLFILYMAVIIYGQMIAMDVATEKSSRVMEILISSASPVTHMFAKIIGIALLGLTQMLVMLFAGYQLFTMKKSELTEMMFEGFGFTSGNLSLYVYAFVFFILGYLLYATIAAMLGSLVSRVEDVNQLIMPMIFLIMIAFFIAMFGLGVPDAKFITITSYIPFFTPMIMFLRIGMLDIAMWEVVLSISGLILTIIILSYIGARIYRGGVLMYGPSRSLKDIKNAFLLSRKEK